MSQEYINSILRNVGAGDGTAIPFHLQEIENMIKQTELSPREMRAFAQLDTTAINHYLSTTLVRNKNAKNDLKSCI